MKLHLPFKEFRAKTRRVLTYGKPHFGLLTFIIIFSIFMTGISLINPYLIKLLIDDVLIGGNLRLFAILLAFFFLVFLVGTSAKVVLSYRAALFAELVSLDVKMELFEHIEKLHMGFFHKKKIGDIIVRLIGDTSSIQAFIGTLINRVFLNILSAIGILAISLYLNYQVTLLSLLVFPFFLVVQRHYAAIVKRKRKGIIRKGAKIMGFLFENLKLIKLVQIFEREEDVSREYKQKSRQLIGLNLSMVMLRAYATAFTGAIAFVPLFIILSLGGYNVILGTLTIGSLIALYTYIGQLFGPISVLGTINITLQEQMASIDRIFEFLDTKPKIIDRKSAKELKVVNGDIEFKNASFSYVDGEKVLENISFKLKAGNKLEIVGQSGEGKTTIADLLCRFFDVDKGNITIDGVDVRDFTLKSLRRHIGVVSQETFLFNISVKDNIRFGKPNATESEIMQAAKLAQIHDRIMKLPKAYDTIIGSSGVKLSGGELQRLSIARAILKNPTILILDEATSSLDAESEHKVHEALDYISKERTTLVITHRLSSIKDADQIIVLKDHNIAESGSFANLMRKSGEFQKIYEMQFKGFQNFQKKFEHEYSRAVEYKEPMALGILRFENIEDVLAIQKGKSNEIYDTLDAILTTSIRKIDFFSRVPHTNNLYYVAMPETTKPTAAEIILEITGKINAKMPELNLNVEILTKAKLKQKHEQIMMD